MIYHCRQNPNADTVFREFKRLLALVTERPVRYKDAVYALKYFMSKLCGELPGRREYFELEDSLQFIFDNFYSADEIETEFRFLIKEIFDTAQRGCRDKKQLADEIKAYLDANYRKNITNQVLSEQFGFVASYLSSIFKEYYQLTPSDYMIQKRMETAKYLLANENGKIKDVAIMIGYEDPLYFSKVFKRYFGMSPREYTGHIEAPKS